MELRHKSLLFALETLYKSKHEVTKSQLVLSQKGDIKRVIRVLDDAIDDGLILSSKHVKVGAGRPAQFLSLSEKGKSFYKAHKSEILKERKKVILQEKEAHWRNVSLTIKDAKPLAGAFYENATIILALSTYVAVKVPEGEFVLLESVLAKAPLFWDAYTRTQIIESARFTWLKYGGLESTFLGDNSDWYVGPSNKMVDEIEEQGGLDKYTLQAKALYKGWPW